MAAPKHISVLSENRTILLPGRTTDGHYQIELSCESCHSSSFSTMESIQQACVRCHGQELKDANDSHPRAKFTDPRNADRVAELDARWCITCHKEHQPEVTTQMGLSLPTDYCFSCHEDIGEHRPTHKDLGFETCNQSGCHNFHDNRALYEEFLVRHRSEPATKTNARLVARNYRDWAVTNHVSSGQALGPKDQDAPTEISTEIDAIVLEWANSGHASSGVNCLDCHQSEESTWQSTPDHNACKSCHPMEVEGFLASRHGMRLAENLRPMQPSMARLPMQDEALHNELTCSSCHKTHRYDTRHAAVDACLGCHADQHSIEYKQSTHFALWENEPNQQELTGTGVSCASCHLPRITHPTDKDRVTVAHNQNDYLRPHEKMIRPVCLSCHGLGFTLNALADNELVKINFQSAPTSTVESINFATKLRWSLEGRRPPWEKEAKPSSPQQESTPTP